MGWWSARRELKDMKKTLKSTRKAHKTMLNSMRLSKSDLKAVKKASNYKPIFKSSDDDDDT